MFTSQISKALASDPYVSKVFAGVFPCDRVPPAVTYPCAVVVNTDPAEMKGEHWVSYYFDGNGDCDYFDSYGRPPSNHHLFRFLVDNSVTPECNRVWLQGLDSNVCGQYCIAFLADRARGKTMDEIVNVYRGRGPGDNDATMARVVNKTYEIKQRGGGGGSHHHNSPCEQCCCSLSGCRAHKMFKKRRKR
jgi:hypothetical protein